MKKKILIVDDEPYLIDIQEQIIKREGYESITAETGKQAVEIAAAQLPDLILLDFSLPDMDGLEVARLIHANPKSQSTPIIFVTGDTSLEQKDKCLEAGFSNYINKPFKPEQIRSSIRRMLK
jgi:CheY-like chemotaxis protein